MNKIKEQIKTVKDQKEVKKEIKKDLEGKLEYETQNRHYQVRYIEKDDTVMVYIKRGQRILVRLLPAMPVIVKK